MTASTSVVAEKDETGRIFYTTVGHSTNVSAKKVRTVASLPVSSHPTNRPHVLPISKHLPKIDFSMPNPFRL
jgi:hypothetical protein